MRFLRGTTRFDCFLKAYQSNETKEFLHDECFDCLQKLNNKEYLPFDCSFIILRNSIPLEKDYIDIENFIESGSSQEQAVAKLGMENVPSTGTEKYVYLQSL